MRHSARSAAFLLLAVGCAALSVPAQNSAQQNVTVVLLNVLPQPPQPVKAVRVSLSYLDSSVLITDAQQVTNSQGQALLLVSPGVSQRGDLRLQVTGATDLVIYQPADGQLAALPATVRVSMLPKGSPALLGPAQIEALLHRTLLQVSSLQKQVSALKQNAAVQSRNPDLSAAVADFAQANGFSSSQVDQQVQQWAEQIQRDSAQATLQQKALAEVALKHYAEAAQLFHQAAEGNHDSIEATEAEEASLEKALLDKVRGQLRQLIGNSQQSASASQLNLQYHQATQTLESAETTAAAEYTKHPGDDGFHALWLQSLFSLANARRQEGEVSPADRSLPLMAQSAQDFQSLAQGFAQLGDARQSAVASIALGVTLSGEGERASGDKSIALLGQSVQAFEQALQVLNKASLPKEWASAEANLGNALRFEGERTGGDKAFALLDQALHTCQRALEVYTKDATPRDWADTETDIGNVLFDEANRASADKAVPLFRQSAQAFRNALEVYTKADTPRFWAGLQSNLGAALESAANLLSGSEARALFDEAVQANQRSLEVYNQRDVPQDWARTESNLCDLLGDDAMAASADEFTHLVQQAVAACQSALQVYTKAELPQNWAKAHVLLGYDFWLEATHSGGVPNHDLLNQAVEAYHQALEVYNKTDLPGYWAWTQLNLAYALEDETVTAPKDRSDELAAEAMQAFQNAVGVFTQAAFPQEWSGAELSIAELNLWAGNYADCLQHTSLVAGNSLLPPQTVVRDAVALSCQSASGNKSAALATEKALLAEVSLAQTNAWDLNGTLHFLSHSPAFAKGRPSWIALFTAIRNADSAGMTAALHQLEPLLHN